MTQRPLIRRPGLPPAALAAVAVGLLVSSAAAADTLCAGAPCQLAVEFRDGGQLLAEQGVLIRFGDQARLELGTGGTLATGDGGTAQVADLLADPSGSNLRLGRGARIDFGAGGRFVLGLGGNLNYERGAPIRLEGISDFVMDGDRLSIDRVDSGGLLTITADTQVTTGLDAGAGGLQLVASAPQSQGSIDATNVEIATTLSVANLVLVAAPGTADGTGAPSGTVGEVTLGNGELVVSPGEGGTLVLDTAVGSTNPGQNPELNPGQNPEVNPGQANGNGNGNGNSNSNSNSSTGGDAEAGAGQPETASPTNLEPLGALDGGTRGSLSPAWLVLVLALWSRRRLARRPR